MHYTYDNEIKINITSVVMMTDSTDSSVSKDTSMAVQ